MADFRPGASYRIQVNRTVAGVPLKDDRERPLQEAFSKQLRFGDRKPSAGIVGSGSVLAAGGRRELHVASLNAGVLEVQAVSLSREELLGALSGRAPTVPASQHSLTLPPGRQNDRAKAVVPLGALLSAPLAAGPVLIRTRWASPGNHHIDTKLMSVSGVGISATAAGFESHRRVHLVSYRDRLAHLVGGEVVDQHLVGACGDRLAQAVECVDLDLDRDGRSEFAHSSERLGHANIGITIDLYSHAIPSLEESAAAKIASLFMPADAAL